MKKFHFLNYALFYTINIILFCSCHRNHQTNESPNNVFILNLSQEKEEKIYLAGFFKVPANDTVKYCNCILSTPYQKEVFSCAILSGGQILTILEKDKFHKFISLESEFEFSVDDFNGKLYLKKDSKKSSLLSNLPDAILYDL